MSAPSTVPPRIARLIRLTGCVQGMGLRPTVARLADRCQMAGWIQNCRTGVEILVEGLAADINGFLDALPTALSEIAPTSDIHVREVPTGGRSVFEIRPSSQDEDRLATQVPRDVVVCAECLHEVLDRSNRRFGYPFTTCARCGPRYSIIRSLPFDRSRTVMERFAMCERCRTEYDDPHDRRCHAQTMSCPNCGPQVWCVDRSGTRLATGVAALRTVNERLRTGGIVAVRGIGGYQLLCDATQSESVQRLRAEKGRLTKPLAVMVSSVEMAAQLAVIDHSAIQALRQASNPIVIVPARSDNGLAVEVHPRLNSVGLLLPSSPLHELIADGCQRPLIVTSGNVEGEPLETEPHAAESVLANIADLWLHHDRPIQHAVDDSVVRMIAGRPVTIRLARGLVPWPLELPAHARRPVLATGGHQKSALALSNGVTAVLGPHLGDLEGFGNRERYVAHADCLQQLYGLKPDVWACDLHPDYFTTSWARRQTGRVVAVQHHHAHIVAGMYEHRWLDREVLGIAFDGTGYGTDCTVWGGEFLRSTTRGFQRVAHLRTFPLLGGAAAIHDPLRVAIALIAQVMPLRSGCDSLTPTEARAAERYGPLLDHSQLSPVTSSVGRLFDGVSALILGDLQAGYEGECAAVLEAICDLNEAGGYSFGITDSNPVQLDWRPLIRELLADRDRKTSPVVMAMRFHRGLARATAAVCRQFSHLPVVLGGGVFQNRILVELIRDELDAPHQPCGLPGQIPPNDGGLAVGQLIVAASSQP